MKRLMERIASKVLHICIVICLAIIPSYAFADILVTPDEAGEAISTRELPPLESLELLADNGLETAIALAEVRRSQENTKLMEQRSGGKLFGTVSYGYNDEPLFETSAESRSYTNLSLSAGVTFPLMGSHKKEQIAELDAENSLLESDYYRNMLLLNNLVTLRKAYSTLWIEQQKEKISKNFLDMEAETLSILENRQKSGFVLPADKLSFLSIFQEARRDMAYSQLRQKQALNTVIRVTGQNWEIRGEVAPPTLPVVEGRNINIAEHPEAIYQLQRVSQYEKLAKIQRKIDREADLSVGVNAARDFPGDIGTGAYVAFTIREPFGAIGNDPAREAAMQELLRAQNEEEYTRLRLVRQAEELYAVCVFSAADVKTKYYYVLSATEAVRERMLRRASLPGDTFESLQQSRAQYYRAALEMLEQEDLFLQSSIDLISFIYPKGITSEPNERNSPVNINDISRITLLSSQWQLIANNAFNIDEILDSENIPKVAFAEKPLIYYQRTPDHTQDNDLKYAVASNSINWGKFSPGVYVWKAEPFLQPQLMGSTLEEVSQAGFARMLLSLNGKEIKYVLSKKGRKALNDLLSLSDKKGVRVDLLLGDPTWALQEHRDELLKLVDQLGSFAFKGIHLDIEPDSLPNAAGIRTELLKGLAETVRRVQLKTDLPVSISIHPRYLEGDLGALSRELFMPLNLEAIVVMLYSSNVDAVCTRMSKILDENNSIAKNIFLAQSVEKSIASSESYGHSTKEEFNQALTKFESKLGVEYKMDEIFIQSWEDFEENKI